MSAQTSPMLEVSGVDQTFRMGFWMKQVQVLHQVNLFIPKGSIFGFLGANGAGKTTLMNLIVGLRRPTAGFVKVAGFEAATRDARARIGYLPERPYFHDHLTGESLLKFFGALSGMTKAETLERIPIALEAVGMKDARRVELKKYSKGMLQRIGIAQALLHNPEFLVLDEPMSGLDPLGRKEMRELIVRMASEGRTILFSSHVIPDVEAICDQVALIQKGRLIGCGPIAQFLSQGQTHVEFYFKGIDVKEVSAAIPELKTPRQTADGIRAMASGLGTINPILVRLLEIGAEIQSVVPIRPSLESMFGEELYTKTSRGVADE